MEHRVHLTLLNHIFAENDTIVLDEMLGGHQSHYKLYRVE